MRSSILFAFVLPALGFAQDGAGGGIAVRSGVITSTATFVARQSVTAGQPYSCEQVSEHTQTLTDGTNISDRRMVVRMYRDSAGRTRTERPMMIGPSTAAGADTPMMVEIFDPVAGYRYMLDTSKNAAHRSALPSGRTFPAAPPPPSGATRAIETQVGAVAMIVPNLPGTIGAARPARPEMATETLGTKMIDGNPAEGHRTTMTFSVGSIGNDRPVVVTNESWNSTELGIMLLTTSHDPRSGDNTTKIENLSRAEPDPTLFQIPADYEIVDDSGPMTLQFSGPPPPPPPPAR